MKKIIIYSNTTGTLKAHVVIYPESFTDEQIKEDFDNTTFGYSLVAIKPYSEIDKSNLPNS